MEPCPRARVTHCCVQASCTRLGVRLHHFSHAYIISHERDRMTAIKSLGLRCWIVPGSVLGSCKVATDYDIHDAFLNFSEH